MEPTIKSKEMIIIKEQNEYVKGDIITYRDSFGGFVTHRIIDVRDDGFITQGDSNTAVDDIVKKSNIEGKVILHSIALGFIYLNVLKPLIIIIVLLYLLSLLKYIIFAKILLKISKYC